MTPDDLDDIRTRAAHINESGGFPGLPAEVERLIRTDVPVMAAEVERLRTEVERLEGARAAADYYRGMHGALRAEIDRLTAERDEARYDARLMERHANAATRAYQRIAASDDPAGDARPALDALLDHLAEHMDDETDPPERELGHPHAAAVPGGHHRTRTPGSAGTAHPRRTGDLLMPTDTQCGARVHKNCACIRPKGHTGPCNCTYRDGVPDEERDKLRAALRDGRPNP